MTSQQSGTFTQNVRVCPAGNRNKITFPALVFNRTPNRQRTPIANQQPARPQTPVVSSKRSIADHKVHSPQLHLRSSKASERNLQGSRCTNKQNRNSINFDTHFKCYKHPDKDGRYVSEQRSGETMVYCEKCAILLASQGVKVTKLTRQFESTPKHSSLRRSQLNSIVTLSDKTIETLSHKHQELNVLTQPGSQLLSQQLTKLNEYFDQVQRIVHEHRLKYQAQLEAEYLQSKQIGGQLQQILADSIREALLIKSDIVGHQHQIGQMEEEKYNPVLEFYKFKLSSYKNIPKEWTIKEIMPEVPNFRNVEELEESLPGLLGVKLKEGGLLTSSKKLRGRNASIYFSFDAEKDVIPEQTVVSQEDLE